MTKATLAGAVLLGLAVGSVPALAEVQNVRVGGDVTIRAFHRETLDLRDESGAKAVASGGFDDNENFFMTTTGLNVAADLTENVSAFVRLANERDWNVDSAAHGDFDISQSYITLKELFYSPLTVTIGTQPIVWGRGFVLGSNLLPGVLLAGGDRNGAITANEFTDFTSFDAIRATLDLGGVAALDMPLTADYVYIRQDENAIGSSDDQTIQGVNLSTSFDAMNSEAELYYLNLRDKAGDTVGAEVKDGSVNTIGIRGSAQPADGSYVYGELAFQFGKSATDLELVLPKGNAHQAWAANLGTEYTFADATATPMIGGEWRFYSGGDLRGPANGAVAGWRAIAPGYFRTALREFQSRTGVTGFYPNDQTQVTSSQTNQHELAVYGSFQPVEDLKVDQRLSWFLLDVPALVPVSSAGTEVQFRNRFLGTEWDTMLTYDYTDDVQFGVIYGVFFPGSVYRRLERGTASGDNTAQELVTSVSLKF